MAALAFVPVAVVFVVAVAGYYIDNDDVNYDNTHTLLHHHHHPWAWVDILVVVPVFAWALAWDMARPSFVVVMSYNYMSVVVVAVVVRNCDERIRLDLMIVKAAVVVEEAVEVLVWIAVWLEVVEGVACYCLGVTLRAT